MFQQKKRKHGLQRNLKNNNKTKMGLMTTLYILLSILSDDFHML